MEMPAKWEINSEMAGKCGAVRCGAVCVHDVAAWWRAHNSRIAVKISWPTSRISISPVYTTGITRLTACLPRYFAKKIENFRLARNIRK